MIVKVEQYSHIHFAKHKSKENNEILVFNSINNAKGKLHNKKKKKLNIMIDIYI